MINVTVHLIVRFCEEMHHSQADTKILQAFTPSVEVPTVSVFLPLIEWSEVQERINFPHYVICAKTVL